MMQIQTKFRNTVAACLVAILLPLVSFSAHGSDLTADAERLMRQFARDSGAPGLSVSVGSHGKLLWSEGFGYADLEQKVPVSSALTKFRVGSIAKPMTALALVTLVGRGRIDLDAEVQRYVPTFPQKKYPITIRQLAGHLAGIRHYAGNESDSRVHYASVLDSLAIFKDDPLIDVPGEKWHYSSYGYNLLSAAIEQAAGEPFLDYMSDTVFKPLGMTQTVPDQLAEVVSNRGRYYFRRDGKYYNEPEVDNSYKWASGGILSTTDDLVRFGLAHMDPTRVSPASLSLLWTEQKTTSGEATGYGIGWRIAVDADGNRWIGHGGGSTGGTSQLWVFPEHGLVIAMASNLTELNYADVLPRLGKLFIEHETSHGGPIQ
jgi:CubicO group peptidase (beta-lactamase class C family)